MCFNLLLLTSVVCDAKIDDDAENARELPQPFSPYLKVDLTSIDDNRNVNVQYEVHILFYVYVFVGFSLFLDRKLNFVPFVVW